MNPNSPPPKASPQSIWSLVLGILSITCLWILGSIPAIILGALGIKKAKAAPETVGGKGMCIAGIICGSVGIVFSFGLLVVASVALPAFTQVADRAHLVKDMSNMRQIGLGLQMYADDNEGRFPAKLDDLYPDYIDIKEVFLSKKTDSAETAPYVYRPGLKSNASAFEPILISPHTYSNRKAVGFATGLVREVKEPELSEIEAKFEE